MGLEVSSLDNPSLVGFTLNTITTLSFLVMLFCSIIIIYYWALISYCDVDNLIEIGSKQVYYKVGPSPWSEHNSIVVQSFLIPYAEYTFVKI